VVVANGDRVANTGCYNDLKIVIIGEVFNIEFYGLALGSYEMVLGVQWLASLQSVLWDFKNRTLSSKRHGRTVS
jgi:hypothetical protein